MSKRVITRPDRPVRCPCNRCRTKRTMGFCPSHAAFLEQVREELKGANRRAGGRQTIPGSRGQYEQEDET